MPSTNSREQITTDYLKSTAELKNLPRFIAFVGARAQQLGFSPKRTSEIELVIEEALVNVMEYAYPEQSGFLKLALKPEPGGGLRFQIWDRGATFNPLECEDPNLKTGLMDRPVGGLGIFLMKKLTDGIFWQRQNDENCLTIIFRQRHA